VQLMTGNEREILLAELDDDSTLPDTVQGSLRAGSISLSR